MYRGQVTAVDASGVYVLIPALHPTVAFGPLDRVGAKPAVGARVLVADCGDESTPDLVVMTGGLPATSTDNAVPRFDGTGGALQGSGVTIDDSNNVTGARSIYWGNGGTLLGDGQGNDCIVVIDDDPGKTSDVRLRANNTERWIIQRTNDAESGSNAGSNFRLYRRADDGSGLSYPITINRATGRITLGDVGSAAGLEFGSSGPRQMVGTGDPHGIAAPVGSTWRQTDANTSHGSLTGLLWTKFGTGSDRDVDWLVDYEGRWVDWTPTLTNITRGTGYTQRNRYTRSGKSLTFDFALKFGASASVSGSASLTLPVAPVNTEEKLFPALVRTTSQYSAGSLYHGGSSTTADFYIWATNGTYLGNLASLTGLPGSWDSTGRISVTGTYEIA